MRPVSFIFILILAVSAVGCSAPKYFRNGVQPTDLSGIQPGVSRQTIEKLLGQSIESERRGDHQVDIYEYNIGRAGRRPPGEELGGALFSHPLSAPLGFLYLGGLSAAAKSDFKKQRGQLTITYAADDTAIAIEGAAPERRADGRFKLGLTTRAVAMIIMGDEPSLALRGGAVLVYRETLKTFLIIEFDGDVVVAVTTTTACTSSGICIVQTEDKRLPPLVYAPPGEEAIAKDFSTKPEHGCAIYAYSDIKIRNEFIDLQTLLLDQQPAGLLHQRGYFWWLVSPGTHTLEVLGATSDNEKHSPKMLIDCQPGEIYFIRTKTSGWSSINISIALTRRVSKYLEQVDEKKGRKEIGKRRLLMGNFAFPAGIVEHPIGP